MDSVDFFRELINQNVFIWTGDILVCDQRFEEKLKTLREVFLFPPREDLQDAPRQPSTWARSYDALKTFSEEEWRLFQGWSRVWEILTNQAMWMSFRNFSVETIWIGPRLPDNVREVATSVELLSAVEDKNGPLKQFKAQVYAANNQVNRWAQNASF